MMDFKDILIAVKKQYSFTNCYIADNVGVEDEVVDLWEAGKAVPNAKEAKKFSECFAIPEKIIQTAIEINKEEKL